MKNRVLVVAVAISFAACEWPVPAEDAGDPSYVRQVVPILQGRKIRGHAETKLLTDLVTLTGRRPVLEALMNQPDYVSHWSEVLVDDLRVQREGLRSQGSCYGTPLRSGTPTQSLATSVLTSAPTSGLSPSFNMTDLLSSSLVLDNVYPAYAAHLFALQNRPGAGTELGMRENVGRTFGHVYLQREMLCLSCHNSEYSASGESTGWDRTHPIRGYFERALYGSATGAPTDSAYAMFRTDVLSGTTGGSSPLAPWGLTNCGSFDQVLPNDPQGFVADFADIPPGRQVSVWNVRAELASGYAGLDTDGLQRRLSPEIAATCTFCATSCSGTSVDIPAVANSATNASTVKAMLTTTDWNPSASITVTCLGCHGGSAGLNLSTGTDWANELIGVNSTQMPTMRRVDPGNAANSYLIRKLRGMGMAAGTARMPVGGTALTAAQIATVEAWINSMPALSACGVCATTDCTSPGNYVSGSESFAFLTAASVVNNVWDEAMGAPLTIGNYFPRNEVEHQVLRDLTEFHFIPRDWSVKSVLGRALTSRFFNRVPPQLTTLSSAYVVPPVYNPWSVADPRASPVIDPGYDPTAHPDNHLNSMGEGVYRYSARNLLNSIHKALGWPAPARFPGSAYPEIELQRAIGQYLSDASPGGRSVDLQGLLYWENVHGACVKPSGVTTDWIDRVVTAVGGIPPTDPSGPVTVEQVVIILRDWLLGNGEVSTVSPVGLTDNEVATLAAYFGVSSLSEPVSSVTDLAGKLRGYCGVLVETPQFMLAGIAPPGLGPEPRVRVCNSPPCTYYEMCLDLAPAINSFLDPGLVLVCGEDWVSTFEYFEPPPLLWEEWCFGPGCGLIVDFVPPGCFQEVLQGPPQQGQSFCTLEAPSCDVRSVEVGSCGGPMPEHHQRGARPLVLAWAESVTVEDAYGVKIRMAGAQNFTNLQAGHKLQHGDLLAVTAGARLKFFGAEASVETPPNGAPQDLPNGVLFFSILGQEAVQRQIVTEFLPQLPVDHIQRVQQGWAKRGEAGPQRTYDQFKGYVYPQSERGQ